MSGFHKDDGLNPVITLVIYWAPGEWDSASSLHEMLRTDDPRILNLVPDYRMNLLIPDSIQDFKKFSTELAEVLEFVKYSKNKVELDQAINENPAFQNLDRRSVELINAVTDADIAIPEGKETVNMCTAIKEMREESKTEGIAEGQLQMIKNLMETMNWTASQAMDALKIPEADRKKYLV